MAKTIDINEEKLLKKLLNVSFIQSDQLNVNLKKVLEESPSSQPILLLSLSDYEALLKIIEEVTSFGLVKDFQSAEEKDYDARDFEGLTKCAIECFECLNVLVPKIRVLYKAQKLFLSILVPIIKLCATHSEEFAWSNANTVSLSSEILQRVLDLTKATTIRDLLCQQKDGYSLSLLKATLMDIQPKLTKDNWTSNPSTCYIFKWLLFSVDHPHLADYLTDVLPSSLIFLDHHATRNKVLGIQCLDHIVGNVVPMELKAYGRADVIYDALFHNIYLRESDIVKILYPCLFKLLAGQEVDRHKPKEPRTWGRFDDVFHQFLWNMEMEDNIASRQQFSSHLISFIEVLGITILKHFKKTKKVLLTYLSIFEGPEEISRINTLKALSLLIKIAWPRMEHHCEDFMSGILDLVYDIETNRASPLTQVKQSLLNHCKDCLLLLKKACPEKFMLLLESLEDVDKTIPGLQFVQNINLDESVV